MAKQSKLSASDRLAGAIALGGIPEDLVREIYAPESTDAHWSALAKANPNAWFRIYRQDRIWKLGTLPVLTAEPRGK